MISKVFINTSGIIFPDLPAIRPCSPLKHARSVVCRCAMSSMTGPPQLLLPWRPSTEQS
jgi:hypothetical protein